MCIRDRTGTDHIFAVAGVVESRNIEIIHNKSGMDHFIKCWRQFFIDSPDVYKRQERK